MNRRELMFGAAVAAMALSLLLLPSALADDAKPRKVLFFSKSSGFEHSVIKMADGKPMFVQPILDGIGAKHAMTFTYSKDGSLFSPEYLAQFDAYVFYTTGDLLSARKDGNPPLTPAGKQALFDAITNGKGFFGIHSATDTFHTGEAVDTDTSQPRTWRYRNLGDKADPYTRMIGAEFIVHGKQQPAVNRVVDKKFPGFAKMDDSFKLNEEWYTLTDFSHDLHVLLVQETQGMQGDMYNRPPFPATWARKHGKGRVFYTSMGHRDDIWTNPMYQDLLVGGLSWVTGNVDADVTPNIETVCPDCWKLAPPPAPKTASK